jgi:hypothetical protein
MNIKNIKAITVRSQSGTAVMQNTSGTNTILSITTGLNNRSTITAIIMATIKRITNRKKIKNKLT